MISKNSIFESEIHTTIHYQTHNTAKVNENWYFLTRKNKKKLKRNLNISTEKE